MELLYVGPIEGGWRDINAGDIVGQAVDLQGLGYPDTVTPHVHVQIHLNGQRIDPTPFFGL